MKFGIKMGTTFEGEMVESKSIKKMIKLNAINNGIWTFNKVERIPQIILGNKIWIETRILKEKLDKISDLCDHRILKNYDFIFWWRIITISILKLNYWSCY